MGSKSCPNKSKLKKNKSENKPATVSKVNSIRDSVLIFLQPKTIDMKKVILALLLLCTGFGLLKASSHREAPLISNDPLADNVDLYAFRSPDNPNTITLIATYVPFQLPFGGPNYYTFGENIRYEIHVDNDASKPGDEITYRFTFKIQNEDPTTFFNIRLGKQNQKATYTLERSMDGGMTFQTIIENGIVPPNNIGPRSIESNVGLGAIYESVWKNAIMNASTGEKVFAGPTDDPFFVDLGGIFDLGNAPRVGGKPVDNLACMNVSALVIQVPIATLLKSGAPETPTNILDPDYVIGVWASASRPAMRTLGGANGTTFGGDWVQVSRLGMPLTNEAVIPIGYKDFWNSITPYQEISDTLLDQFFYNPELALYMDDDLFGGAVPAFAPLRIQKSSLGAFDFTNGADGVSALAGTDLTGTAFEAYGSLLLLPGKPRSVDLWPAFHTGVPNAIPYQLATGKNGNPLAAGKPFINNFLPNGGDMLRLNMAVPVTSRTDANFSSLGLVQAAAIGLTVAPFNTTADLEFIPNMDGFPNGRRLEDDVTRIELQAVSGVVLAAVGLWYDDFDPASSPSPVTQQLLNVLTYTTGVEKNDKDFSTEFPYLAMPHRGTEACQGGGDVVVNEPTEEDVLSRFFVSSNTENLAHVFEILKDTSITESKFEVMGTDADGIYYDQKTDVVYQLDRTNNVIRAYSNVVASLKSGGTPELTATSTSDFKNGREIAVVGDMLVVAQDASAANDMVDQFVTYKISPTSITLVKKNVSPVALWGIHLTSTALYAVADVTNDLIVFPNFLSAPEGALSAMKTIDVEGIVRTHGITYYEIGDMMILTDIGDAGSAADGDYVVIKNFTSAMADDSIKLSEQVVVGGSNTSLGNPVDIAFDDNTQMIFVAERAAGGGQVLGFPLSASGNVAPSYSAFVPGASAIYAASKFKTFDEAQINARIFMSSNTTGKAALYSVLNSDSLVKYEFGVPGKDADGIHYDAENDILYQLNRSSNVIQSYGKVVENITNKMLPEPIATSTSNFINGREISVFGNTLVAAQSPSAANGNTNQLVTYTIDKGQITYKQSNAVNFDLWGIQLAQNNLYAVQDNSSNLAIIYNFASKPSGPLTADKVVYIASLRRTHGITYIAEKDMMILTDIESAQLSNDGGLYVIENFTSKAADDTISMTESVEIKGTMTQMGNPVDVAYDPTSNVIFVAERANEGGKLLGFKWPTSGNVAPDYVSSFPGASAIYIDDKMEDVVAPTVDIFDPNFSDDFLVAARLWGNSEVPAVTTDALGVATITFNDDYTKATVNATVANLSSDFMGAHIHKGKPGENGAVVFNLSSNYVDGRIEATINVTKQDVADFINGNFYINVHTANNPGGEIRGNLGVEAAESFMTVLKSSADTSNTAAMGVAMMHYTSNTNVLEVNFLASGDAGEIKTLSLMMGSGDSATVVANWSDALDYNRVDVKIQAGDYIAALRSGGLYLVAGDGSETKAWGQLTKVSGIAFDAWMNGAQEAPSNDGFGLGLVAGYVTSDLSMVSLASVGYKYSGALTGAHFHAGALGAAGGVVVNFTSAIKGTSVVTSSPVAINAATLGNILSGDIYFNVHTARYPGGEVRGQIYRIARDGYAYNLCQNQEVTKPTGTTNEAGSGMLAFNRDYDEMHVMVTVNKLSSAFMGAHIHNGAPGVNGPVVFSMTDKWSNNGTFFYTTDGFTPELAAMIQSGMAYVNVHTANNAGGELRGQVGKNPTCNISTRVKYSTITTQDASLYPNPTSADISLILEGNGFEGATASIFDVNGKLISTTKINSKVSNLETATLSPGMYFVRVQGESVNQSLKFTKQ